MATMVRPERSNPHCQLIPLLAIIAGGSVEAATVQVAADAGIGRTDNVTRVPDGERSATIRSAGVRFSVLQDNRRTNVDVLGDLSWLDYAGNVHPSELVGSAAGRLRLNLVEDHLNWVFEDSFGQVRQDLFSVPGPDNRENINYFSTGPNLRFSIGAATNLLLGGRYVLVDYEESPGDSRRASGSLGVERVLPRGSTLSFNASKERIEARGASFAPDYDREAAYLRYALTGRRSSVALSAGANRVDGSGGNDSGTLLRLELRRDVGRLSVLNLRAGRELTDSGATFALDEGGQLPSPGSGIGTSLQTSQPYTGTYVEAGWRVVGRRTSIGLDGGWNDQNYDGAGALDIVRKTLGLDVTRSLGTRTTAAASVRLARNQYAGSLADNDEISYSANLSWAAGRRLSLELAGEHFAYSTELAPTVHETRYWMRARYGHRIER